MYNKTRSKTLTKLPKITYSPVKSRDQQRMSVKLDQKNSKFTAAAYAIFTQDLNLITCINFPSKSTIKI